jgi:hypothetical protein
MELFQIENDIVVPNIETLMLPYFKEIWERDKTSKKGMAMKIFCYVEFMCSPKKSNPYHGYQENIRKEKIVKDIFKTEWEPDELVLKACELYTEFFENASPSLRFLASAIKASDSLIEFLNNVDLAERNPQGTPIYKPVDITRTLKDTKDVLQNLNALKEKVNQEIYESSKTRSGKEINYFEK